MFAEFGSVSSLLGAGAPWGVAIQPWVIGAAGVALTLALVGLVLRSKSGSGGASSDPVPRETISTGGPVSRPRKAE